MAAFNEIDPTQPIYPLRTTKLYPVPPVCSAQWTAEDWERTATTVTEQDTIANNLGTFKAIGRRADGVLLYRKV